MAHRFVVLLVLSWMTLVPPTARAQIEPQGLYFHRFTGAATGSVWSTWGPIAGAGRYNFSDLRAEGSYDATVSPAGAVTLDGGLGAGSFSDPDNLSLTFTLPGFTFHSTITRAPYTDTDFPVFLAAPVAGDAALSGAWRARILDIDPLTGATLATTNETVEVAVAGTTARVTRADGSFYQAAWKSEDQAGFRVVQPTALQTRYRTFPGSATSEPVNLVGEIRVQGPNAMRVTLFTQSRTPFGTQTQAAQVMELTRIPAPAGSITLLAGGVLAGAGRRRRGPTCSKPSERAWPGSITQELRTCYD